MKNLKSEYLLVKGGKQLNGEVRISGAKNSALKQMAAALVLSNGVSTLHNVPDLADIENMSEIIRFLGGTVERSGETLTIDCRDLSSSYVPFELTSKLRASFVVLGALVTRFKEAKVALPGGCKLGARKLGLHIKGIKALGIHMDEEQGYVDASLEKGFTNLVGNKIYLDLPSNGATENIMLAAVLADGETVIENAAKDPEIVDLANFLKQMGCDIEGAGSSSIHIKGKKPEELHSFEHSSIPDRVEAATYMAAAMITHGKVTIKDVIEEDLQSILSKLEEIGASVTIHAANKKLNKQDLVHITVDAQGKELKGTEITTVWYPGFPTDVQPLLLTLLTLCRGTSVITETIYESRYQHVEDLQRMGANINVNGKVAVIEGVKKLTGAKICGPDLRGAAALILGALAAEGKSEVRGLEHLDRGYERLEEKFTALGAEIKRVEVLEEALNATEDNTTNVPDTTKQVK